MSKKTSELGKRLRDLMFEMDISYADFERNGVCSECMVRKYISGDCSVGSEILKRMCLYMNVSCDYLLGISDTKRALSRWIFVDGECLCSKCGGRGETTFKWCPNCGEKMNVE